MNLLIVTQKVDINDPILGFFVRWIEEFAKNVEKVTVICLEKGEYNLPENVKVLSLGKEDKLGRLIYLKNFYKYIWQERKNYDAVFVHMNPIYVVLGGLLWRSWGKKISLWYLHKSVDLKLRIAEKLTDTIFTASEKSFRLKSHKINIVGHGIDTNTFSPKEVVRSSKFKIITVGRITPIKDYETLLKAAEILKKAGKDFLVTIIGSYLDDSQKEYLESLKKYVAGHGLEGVVTFAGALPHAQITERLQGSDLFVNMSNTGSIDKAVLEAMACGVPAITSNEAFEGILESYGGFFQNGNYEEFSKNILAYMDKTDEEKLRTKKALREEVVKSHNLRQLIGRIVEKLKIG